MLATPAFCGEELDGDPGWGCCPALYVYSQGDYVYETTFSEMYETNGSDITIDYNLTVTPDNVYGVYKMRLTENTTTSCLDQIRLFAIYNGIPYQLPLLSAIHSEYGNVKPQLLSSDDWRTTMLVDHAINVTFWAFPISGVDLLFSIEGYST